MTTIVEELRTQITPGDMRAVYRGVEASLDRYIVQQAATPFRAEAHTAINLAYARYFTLIATTAMPPGSDETLRDQLAESGLSRQDANALFMTAGRQSGALPIGHSHLACYLRSKGAQAADRILC